MNKRSIAALLIALVAGFATPVRGVPLSGTLEGDSTLTPTGSPGVFVQNLTGEGEDMKFGSFVPSSMSTIDFSNPPLIRISEGMFAEVFPQGTLFGTSSGEGTASGHGTATVTINIIITGGTGLFAGAMGEATATGTITSTGPTTESFTGSFVGEITTAPDQATTLALMAPCVLAVFLARRRTHIPGVASELRRLNRG